MKRKNSKLNSLWFILLCAFCRFEAEVKEQKQNEREKKETEKNLAKIEYKIAMEERKYLIARRKLEAIRLMDYLFETIKVFIK